MKVLIIGGTRFLGKHVCNIFINHNHDITIISRKKQTDFNNVKYLNYDRVKGITKIKNTFFDLIFDFIAYKKNDCKHVFENLIFKKYILISSTWVPRLWNGTDVNELNFTTNKNNKLSKITNIYLKGKIQAEKETFLHNKINKNTVIVRLPIFFGNEDRTNRLEFYFNRFIDRKPVLAIDNPKIILQIGWVHDLANILHLFSKSEFLKKSVLWNCLPTNSIKYKDFLFLINQHFGLQSQIIFIKPHDLYNYHLRFILDEPFQNERFLKPSANNIFNLFKLSSTDINKWIFKINLKNTLNKKNREEEIKFLENR